MYAHVHIFNLFGHSHGYGQKNKMKLENMDWLFY